MLNLDIFHAHINNGNFTEALHMLEKSDDTNSCHDEAIVTIKSIHPKRKTPLLHQLAESAVLNDALTEEKSAHHESAKNLLLAVMKHSDFLIHEPITKRTAFVQAIILDHRAIANQMFAFIKPKPEILSAIITKQDYQKNISLHHAINSSNHALIENILESDTNQEHAFYFMRNEAGLYSLPLAMQNYRTNPSALSLSIINQLYFTLPRGRTRTKAVEEEIKMGWGLLSKPLWRYALRMCAKRDANGKIKNIDLNLWDFVVQAINDGLQVWGFNVDKALIYEYSREYSDTPGWRLREGDEKREIGLSGRTLTQAATNNTLARKKEFMQRANLEVTNYCFCHFNKDPLISGSLNKLQADRDWIILYNQEIYYVPQQVSGKPRVCKEIVSSDLREQDLIHFKALQEIINKLKFGSTRFATNDEIKNIIPLVPLIIGQSENVELMVMSRRDRNRHAGMTLFGGSINGASRYTQSTEEKNINQSDNSINNSANNNKSGVYNAK